METEAYLIFSFPNACRIQALLSSLYYTCYALMKHQKKKMVYIIPPTSLRPIAAETFLEGGVDSHGFFDMGRRLRKKPRTDVSINIHIPCDIVVAILSNLPAKTLCRLKCVCKEWHSLISDPKFSFQGKEGREGERAILYSAYNIRDHPRQTGAKFFSLDHQLCLQEIPKPDIELFRGTQALVRFKLLGSCNGLLLTEDLHPLYWKSRYHLWNPTTRSCRHLACADGVLKKKPVASGLCFDQSIDDYKVALMLSSTFFDIQTSPRPYQYARQYTQVSFQSVSLRKGIISECYSIPYNIVSPYHRTHVGVFTNGHLHWIVREVASGDYSIVYFDQNNNQLNALPVPEQVMDSEAFYELGVLNGCLCLFKYEFREQDVGFCQNVLIMREYGVKESWANVPFFNPLRCVGPCHLTTFGEKLLAPIGSRVSAYNVKDKTKKDIDLPPIYGVNSGPVVCEPTLASLSSFKI